MLLVLHEETLGGASRAVLRLVEVLSDRGWDVHVWCSRPSVLSDELTDLGYTVAGATRLMKYRLRHLRHPPGVRARLRSLPAAQLALSRHLRTIKPDLVHVNGRLALPEAITARLTGFPVVTHIHDAALPGARGLATRVVPWLVSREVLAVGRAHARSLQLGRRAPRIVPGATSRTDTAERPPRSAGAPVVVGTLGLLHPIKGTDVFVAAAEQLRARGVAVDMRIAGPLEDGPFRDWGEAVVERATAAGVSYRGVVDAVAELSQWDILVQPSRGDAFPLAVLEAMEAGLAVVGADTGGITEQLEDGAGVLVPPEDPGALADAIAELARDPERIAALAAAGRRRVRTTFTLARSADALEAAWLAALRRAR